MKQLLKLLFLLLLPVACFAQDLRPSAYLGAPGKVTVRGGKVLGATGGVTTIAEQTINPAVSATTYIYIDLNATPVIATSTSAFPSSNYFPICVVTKDANNVITSFTDSRPDAFLGGSGTPASSALAGNTNSIYLSPACPNPSAGNCYFANFDTQYALGDVTCNNASATITIGASDPPFKVTDIGLPIAGISTFNTAANCPPQGTISTFISPTSVTVSVPATATTTTGSLAWGHNDGAAIQTAFNASLGKGCLYLPQGAALFDVPPFLDTRSSATKGPPTCVIGTGQTLLTPLPAFNYSSCVTNGACVFTWSNGANQNPNYALLKDFEIFGLAYNLTGTGTNNFVFNLQRVTMFNIWLWHWGAGIGTGMFFTGPVSAFSPISDTSGTTACAVSGVGGNQTVQLFTPFCGEGGVSMNVASGAFLETFGGQYGPAGNSFAESVSGHWLSVGEVHFQPASTSDTIRVTGDLILDDAQVFGANSNTLGAIDCNFSGATVTFRGNTSIAGGTGGIPIRSVAGCVIKDDSNKLTITGAANSLSGVWAGATSITGVTVTAAKLVLSAGWGASAAWTALSGNTRLIQGTITNTGAGQAANPTITYTFPTPFVDVSSVVCSAYQVGGTQAILAATEFLTPSALTTTGVTFTYNGTPTVNLTEVVQISCESR